MPAKHGRYTTNIPPAHGGSAGAWAGVPGLQQRTKLAAAVLPVCPGGEWNVLLMSLINPQLSCVKTELEVDPSHPFPVGSCMS